MRGALDWPVMSTGRSLSRAHANSVASRVGGERLLNRNELVLLAEPAVPLLHAVPATASLSQCQPTSSCFASETSSLAPCLFQNLNSALDSIRFTPALFQYESSASEASTRPKGPHEDSVEVIILVAKRRCCACRQSTCLGLHVRNSTPPSHLHLFIINLAGSRDAAGTRSARHIHGVGLWWLDSNIPPRPIRWLQVAGKCVARHEERLACATWAGRDLPTLLSIAAM